jgi:hypothetical protein
MVQGVGPEFKPQYQNKTKQKKQEEEGKGREEFSPSKYKPNDRKTSHYVSLLL